VSKNQGQVITFSDGSRVVFRLSGTGSEGATVRMYVERYVAPEAGAEELKREAAEGLKGLIEVALELSKLKEFLGVDKPTVITVSGLFPFLPRYTTHSHFFVSYQ
jgi:phosphoglucomutase